MLAPFAHSDAPDDEASLHDALLKTLHINPEFAPAYVELARLALRQGNLANALAVARKAEQLEPSRAGYHLLCGQILLRQGRYTEAAAPAKYVADLWYQADHDEAVELWNAVPAAQRPGGDVPSEIVLQGTEGFQGQLKTVTCGDQTQGIIFDVENKDSKFSLHSKGGWSGGYSDTLWYGADHFDHCHHVAGLRAVGRYKPASDKSYTGDLVEFELRDDFPAAPPVAKTEEAKPDIKQ